ncbi:xanthine dehydrogenase family protein molybdopterin-binding subunit [Haloferax sp. DFSO52]|uniref:xanthine dehydrogenase family protein molybdopterin-binding subunit n=1 Tax=Haloferax sp. DFSO52 TaxID=3388505 RepID=UPI003A879F02
MSSMQKVDQDEENPFRSIGHQVGKLDSEEIVRGTIEYGDDLEFADVKHVKICRSTIPHGDIVDIDTSAADALPGVQKVVTREDVYRLQEDEGYNPMFGPAIRDQPVLALDKVHFIGDAVAAVIADEPDIAEEAIDLVDITYDEYDFAESIDDALDDDAAIVHDSFTAAETFPDLGQVQSGRDTNQAFEFNVRRGDVDSVFEEADHIFENTYRTPHVQHMPLEPFVGVARAENDGSIHLWTPNQSPHFVRNEVANMFGLPQSKVRVEVPKVGGSYGAKLYCKTEPLLALCAYVSGHTVKLKQSIEESFVTNIRHETKVSLKTAVDDDGKLLARKCDVYYDTGAYAEIGPRITKKSGYTAAGPYELDNVHIDSHCVYTNKPPAGAFRGFGVPQLVTAYESQMDVIAHELGLDPIAIRRANGYTEGSIHATGAPVRSVGLIECIDAVRQSMDWDAEVEQPSDPDVVRAKGFACGYKACITPSASGAIVVMHGDGSVTVHSSSVEIGQGVDTTLAQITAEGLGIDIDSVSVAKPHTDTSPFDTITAGSRSTFHMGNALIEAVDDLKDQLTDIAADTWNTAVSDIVVEDGEIRTADGAQSMSFERAVKTLYGEAGGTLVARGHYVTSGGHHDPETGASDDPAIFWFFGASGVVVDIDTATGKLDVKELHNAADVGQAIDPKRVKAQILGGAAHALGQTLTEEMIFEFGQQVNQTLLDYKIPSIKDMPDIVENHIVEVAHEEGPFGAKGVGETGSFAVSPAIINAVANATGAHIDQIPLTPERVLAAIEGGDL